MDFENRTRTGGSIISKTIGILGGMGPEAALLFCSKLLRHTTAKKDQDHIPQLLLNDPVIPDRTKAILSGKTREVHDKLIQNAQRLESAGATCLAMPCNTAHFWADDIQAAVAIPLVHMIRVTLQHVTAELNAKAIGLMSTVGTAKSHIYQTEAHSLNLEIILPSASDQDRVSGVIRAVKAGQYGMAETDTLTGVMDRLKKRGADAFILGCTELPLVLEPSDEDRLIDPMDCLAKSIIHL